MNETLIDCKLVFKLYKTFLIHFNHYIINIMEIAQNENKISEKKANISVNLRGIFQRFTFKDCRYDIFMRVASEKLNWNVLYPIDY